MQILKASSEIWLTLEDLRTTLEFEFLSQHKASHLNMTCWRGSGWPIPVLGATSRRAPGVTYLWLNDSQSGILGYLLLSFSALLLCFSPPPLSLPGLPGALEAPRSKEPLTHTPDKHELHGDRSLPLAPMLLSAARCPLMPSFLLGSGVALSLTSFYFFRWLLVNKVKPKPNRRRPYKVQDQPKINDNETFHGAFNLDVLRPAPTGKKGE